MNKLRIIIKMVVLTAFLAAIQSVNIFAQPKNYTDAEREQAVKDFIKGYTEQNIAKGIEFRNKKQYIAAITVLTKALLVDPHNADALVNRAVTYYSGGQYFRAYEDLNIAVKNNPEHYGANFQQGFVLFQLGYADEALPYLRKALSLSSNTPSKIVAFYTMQAEMFTGNYQKCVENFDVFYKLTNAENKNAYYNDAFLPDAVHIATECYLGLGNRAEAQKTLKLSSNLSSHYFSFMFGNFFDGKINTADKSCEGNADKTAEKAAKLFQKAQEQFKKDSRPDFNKNFQYKYNGWKSNYFESFVEIRNGLRCDPNNISLLQTRTLLAATTIERKHYYRVYYRQLERQLLKTKNPNTDEILDNLAYKDLFADDPKYFALFSIRAEYEKNRSFVGGDSVNLEALDLNFPNADVAIKSAQQLFEDRLPKKDTTTKLLYLNAALELEPNNAEALALRARTFVYSQSRYLDPLAWRDATAALKINPKLVSGYTVRGAILRFEENFPAALVELDKGLAINPNDQKALLNRGLVNLGLGNKDAAFRDLNQIIELSPENGAYYAVRAGAYNADGQTAKAIADYQKASKLNPRYGDQDSDIELIKIYDKIGEKALADAAHKEYYYQFRYWITNKLIPNYDTIANRNPGLIAEIEADFTQQNRNVAAKNRAEEANKRNAAINAYYETVKSYNSSMAYYNGKIDQLNRETTQAGRTIVRDWNSYKTSKALADMRVLLKNLLTNHGANLPPNMKSQVESVLNGTPNFTPITEVGN